ncbi:S8 family peptidase [Paenibacillus alba]|uniref:S8 family serine peptidase n=1 Tax=Paenibacillus alba TaxID=1197127 RepID=A0ABU6G5W8_9BACL|nr:S8 family serine peptidase [Paenibacillus alba]MEC0229365.1 S8 family serine peptidase [Paenibacillus alba]
MKKVMISFFIIVLFYPYAFLGVKSIGNSGEILTIDNSNYDALVAIKALNLNTGLTLKQINRVKVGVIDTPVDTQNLNLNHIFSSTNNKSIIVSPKLNHGNMVASLLGAKSTDENSYKGIIPGLNIYSIPIYQLSVDNLTQAIYQAIDLDINILNISMGTYIDEPELREAVNIAIGKGILIVASAGNDSTSQLNYPASYMGVISVGSIDERYNVSSFTNYNERIDVYSPGWNIVTLVNEDFADTSASAVFVTALAALFKAKNLKMTSAEIKDKIIRTSTKYTGNWNMNKVNINLLNFSSLK